MRTSFVRFTVALGLSCAPLLLTAAPPTPPAKPGLWQVKMTQLDANGKEMPSPQADAMARMSPEAKARMAEMMKARGVMLPDESGAMKACISKESLDSGAWQQVASDSGCTTTYSSTTGSAWKWHTTCTSLKSESDGETVFSGSTGYKTKVTSTTTVMGQTRTSTRVMEGTWLGADCGDIKPIAPPAPQGRGRQ
jgi:hypothetical protein